MGGGVKRILICDSDCTIQGTQVSGITVLSPDRLQIELGNIDISEIAVLVTVASLDVQDEIIINIEQIFGSSICIYTLYAIEWGIYLNIKYSGIETKYREKKLAELKTIRQKNEITLSRNMDDYFRYFAFLPLYNDEIILVYQPGKVASTTIYNSILNYNRHVLHCHVLTGIGETEDDLFHLINRKSGKIISLVRDPVARRIAEMWQNIHQLNRYGDEADFNEIERFYFPDQFDGGEFDWFDRQMKKYLKIDVFSYPFDREKGYSIIKKENLELLLIKMEKLNELENLIGEFLNIKNFRLFNGNISTEKPYRYAYRDYKRNICLPKEMLDGIYYKNERLRHFYTEQECSELYNKWLRYE